MIMPFYIYKITNKINGKIYIGKSKNPVNRFKRHLYVSVHPNAGPNQFQPIHAALAKYGEKNFSLEIIDECMMEDEIFEKEIYWIAFHKSNMTKYPDNGYNLTDGGEGPSGLSPSNETKNKISKANSGKNNGMYNKSHTFEAKQKMSDFQSNRIRQPLSDEHKQKNRNAALRQDFSYRIPQETKKQIISMYASGNYTKKQLANYFNLKYNSVVKIIRSHKNILEK
jgi:group I intron endonuclease